ncbi:MAG: ferrichrome-iron receptor [Nitrospirales bacterium]|nr:MAG: ferrichrome-iron receptor [Nitrospirales bacterium]
MHASQILHHSQPETPQRTRTHLHRASLTLVCWLLLSMTIPSLAVSASGNAIDFDIPAQSLDRALRTFAKQSQTSVLYDSQVSRPYTSQRVVGGYTVNQALNLLLRDTELTYRKTSTGVFTIEESADPVTPLLVAATDTPAETRTQSPTTDNAPVETLPEVLVPGFRLTRDSYSAPNATTATKLDTPIMQTPVSIQVVPPQVLKDQQAIELSRALENVSGVYPSQGFNLTNAFNVRGFQTFTYYRNGMPIEAALTQAGRREMGNIERLEVLKGPASFLYGRINPGGLVNMVTKQPLNKPYYALQQQFGSFERYRTTGDATGPLTKDGSLLYRINFTHETFDSFRDFVDGERLFIVPVLRWEISDQTQITFEMEYQHNETFIDFGVPAIGDRPANLPRRRHLGGEPDNKDESDYVLGGFHWSHAFNDDWSISHRFNALLSTEDGTASLPSGVQADGRTLNRFSSEFEDNKVETYFTTVNVNGSLDTFGLNHTLLVGGDYYNFTNTLNVISRTLNSVDIFAPDFSQGPGALTSMPSHVNAQKERYGIYIQDQIELPFNVFLLAGGRFDYAKVESKGSNVNIDEEALKPRFGILWQPVPQLSFFGSYVENFGSDDFFSVNPDGTVLPPDTADQWEVGVKTELLDGRLRGTLAFYDLTKQNIATPDLNNPTFSRATGEARNRGIELDVTAEILPGWKTIGVYSYIDSEITKDNSGNQGNRFANVPRHGGSFWTTYTFQENQLRGLTLGAGVVARSEQEADNANTAQLPGYALVHLLSSYSWNIGGTRMTTQLNVENLLNKKYFPNSAGSRNRIDVGAPRVFLGMLRAEFN